MKIYLIGMPGCGKSTFGRKTAEILSMKFIDLDSEIVSYAQKPITHIFKEEGEDYFRKIESSLLKSLSNKEESFIMATGGGAPCFFDNMRFMNTHGITIYIDADIAFLLERLSVKGINKRPLLKKLGKNNLEQGLRDQLNHRLSFYSKAQIILPYEEELEKKIVQKISTRT
jgi:shikimate kinase